MKKYEFLPHTADLKIRVSGRNLKEIINNSLLALKEFLRPKIKKEKVETEIEIENEKTLYLLIDFLSEVLTKIYIEKTIFNSFNGEINEKKIKGKIRGNKIEKFSKDIKAITYHQAKLEKNKNLIFEFIVDI